jgi:hypothetical protein
LVRVDWEQQKKATAQLVGILYLMVLHLTVAEEAVMLAQVQIMAYLAVQVAVDLGVAQVIQAVPPLHLDKAMLAVQLLETFLVAVVGAVQELRVLAVLGNNLVMLVALD